MAKKTDVDQARLLGELLQVGRARREPAQLRSARDYTIATTARLGASGFFGGSSTATVFAIEQFILPQFRAQQELPLITVEQLEKAIADALRIPIVNAFSGLGDPKIQVAPDSITGRKEMLSQRLVTRLSLYVRAVAKEAFDAGVAAREALPETLALRSIAELRTSNGNGA